VNWVQPLEPLRDAAGQPRGCYKRRPGAGTNKCCICGWDLAALHLVYPLSPFRPPVNNPYQNLGHFPCVESDLHNYLIMRFQAVRSLTHPQWLIWCASQNNGWQRGGQHGATFTRWMRVEVLDLLIGMKLAGYLPVHPYGPYPPSFPNQTISWARVQECCPLLRVTGKFIRPINQLQKKWQHECHLAYLMLTPQFFAAHVPVGVNANLPPM